MCDSLELVYTYEGLPPVTAWQSIWSILGEERFAEGTFEVYDKSMDGPDVLEYLKRTTKAHFNIMRDAWEFRLAPVGNHDLTFLRVKQSGRRNSKKWQRWVDVLSKIDSFVSARLFDSDYEKWQNATDPLEYQAAGRNFGDLPMRSNDLPPPLDRQVIDTSNNPGRRILRTGYVEAVGAVMWLGPWFVKRTGADLARLETLAGVSVTHQLSGIVMCVAGEGMCFRRADDEEADLQRGLRDRLFPRTS